MDLHARDSDLTPNESSQIFLNVYIQFLGQIPQNVLQYLKIQRNKELKNIFFYVFLYFFICCLFIY